VLDAFFEALMALVVVGTILFAGLVFSKLYQGQR
jgi:hypothetical protein